MSYILPFSNSSQGAFSSIETFQFNTFINKRRKERRREEKGWKRRDGRGEMEEKGRDEKRRDGRGGMKEKRRDETG